MRVILFMFCGRYQNMDLNMPLIRRVLERHPEVEFHGWNFARTQLDNNYLRRTKGDRIVMNHAHFNKRRGWLGMHVPFREYSDSSYEDCVFVKIDDDVVFFETERFGDLVQAVRDNPGVPISGQVVNNGASTRTHPGLWAEYEALRDKVIGAANPQMPLLDVHLSTKYADVMHTYFFTHSDEMLNAPIKLIDTDDWLSINLIGFDWETCGRIAPVLGKPSPRFIAGRDWGETSIMGDEGAFNTMPRKIMQGFLGGHLTFGPQKPVRDQIILWRKRYGEIGKRYLDNT